MNQMYDVAVNGLLDGTLDLMTDPLLVAAYWSQTFDPSNGTLTDVGAPLPGTTAQPLVGRSVTNRQFRADDFTFPFIDGDHVLGCLILYRDTDDMLVAFLDTRPDRMQLALKGNGGPITITWPGGVVISL